MLIGGGWHGDAGACQRAPSCCPCASAAAVDAAAVDADAAAAAVCTAEGEDAVRGKLRAVGEELTERFRTLEEEFR